MRVHSVVSSYGTHSFGVHSPQVPALFAGGTSLGEFTGQALVDLLDEADAPEEYHLEEHRQTYSARGDREWFIRACWDRHPARRAERMRTLELLRELIESMPDPIDTATKAPTGEALFIVAHPDDTVAWLAEQLDPSGSATIVAPVGENGLWTVNITTGDKEGHALDGNLTVRELVAEMTADLEPAEHDFLTEHPLPSVHRARELLVTA